MCKNTIFINMLYKVNQGISQPIKQAEFRDMPFLKAELK